MILSNEVQEIDEGIRLYSASSRPGVAVGASHGLSAAAARRCNFMDRVDIDIALHLHLP